MSLLLVKMFSWTLILNFPKLFIFLKASLKKKVYLFILRERAQTGEGQRQRERENTKQPPCCQHRALSGANLTNHDIMTWAKIKSQMFGAPGWLGCLSVWLLALT